MLRVEDTDTPHQGGKKNKKTPMSQIVGVRKLKHTNSFTGVVPKYGVEATNEEELTKVKGYILSHYIVNWHQMGHNDKTHE